MNSLLWWLIQNSITVAVMIPLALLACRFFRERPAVRHALWVVVLVKFVTPPLVAWPLTIQELREVVVPASVVTTASAEIDGTHEIVEAESHHSSMADENSHARLDVTGPSAAGEHATVSQTQPQSDRITLVILMSWVLGAISYTAFQIVLLVKHARLVQRCVGAPSRLQQEVRHMATQLRLRPPRTLVSGRILSPFIWCLGPLRLIWPEALSSPAELDRTRGVMAHELAHVRRGDHWVAWLELLAGVAWWWNPLFWLVRRELRESSEMACDALAIAANPECRREYAELLLELSAGFKTGAPAHVLAVSAGAPSSFERRLAMILSDRVSGKLSVGGFAVAALFAALVIPVWSQEQASPPVPYFSDGTSSPPAATQYRLPEAIESQKTDAETKPSVGDDRELRELIERGDFKKAKARHDALRAAQRRAASGTVPASTARSRGLGPGVTLTSPGFNVIVQYVGDGSVHIMEAGIGYTLVKVTQEPGDIVTGLSFSAEGAVLQIEFADGKKSRRYDIAAKKFLREDEARGSSTGMPYAEPSKNQAEPASSPDGKLKVELDGEASIRISNAATGDELVKVTPDTTEKITGLSFTADGNVLLIQLAGGEEVLQLDIARKMYLRPEANAPTAPNVKVPAPNDSQGQSKPMVPQPLGPPVPAGTLNVRLLDEGTETTHRMGDHELRGLIERGEFEKAKARLDATKAKRSAVPSGNAPASATRSHKVHEGPAQSPDGKLQAVIDGEASIRIVETLTGNTLIKVTPNTTRKITGIFFTGDSKLLQIELDDGQEVHEFDIARKVFVHDIGTESAGASITPDTNGKYLDPDSMSLIRYDVSHLLQEKTAAVLDGLIADLRAAVLPDTWVETGGNGVAAPYYPGLAVVVRHKVSAHEGVIDFLARRKKQKLRLEYSKEGKAMDVVAKALENGKLPTGIPTVNPDINRKRLESDEVLVTSYRVESLLGERSNAALDKFISELRASVLPNSWNDVGGDAAVTPDYQGHAIVVLHDLDGHERVLDYINTRKKQKLRDDYRERMRADEPGESDRL